MSSETAAAPGDSLEPIKHVTTTEAELEKKVAELRAKVKVALEEFSRESESFVLRARADAERERETLLATAQREGDAEAKAIVASGTARADEIRGKTPAQLSAQKEPILTAILAEFRPTGKRPGA
ncbi:MAG: hypothetical protein L3K02_01455 [Thermoplasmata archaeon]|nr:hypothetical protein [Thermoplasmata archaeon]